MFHGSELILAVSEETKFGFEAVETLMMWNLPSFHALQSEVLYFRLGTPDILIWNKIMKAQFNFNIIMRKINKSNRYPSISFFEGPGISITPIWEQADLKHKINDIN